ncbi:MAG: DUF1800 family protein [Planctomycetes bacterium]|nr:DUF1800 family protein [Planctomycetota bacterium]
MNPCPLLLLLATLVGQEPSAPAWGAREAEHLLNRAGFGANTAALARELERGQAATVEGLLHVDPWLEEPFYARKRIDGDLKKLLEKLPEDERDRRMNELRDEDRAQLADFLQWWVARMLEGEQPLRERMVLFWHGHFTSSMEVVKSSYEMIQQNQLFRRHALGSFRELLHAVAHDPAMQLYLDNASSKKAHPNENFARELLELFTLGEGNYSEEDVQEVARAFTGWTQKNGRFEFETRRHDYGAKRVLGVEGKFNGDDVLDLLLDQPACARHLAGRLLTYFEGCAPNAERRERFAVVLRDADYRIDVFLRALFLDPEFYRAETRAARMTSPLDYLVGHARRLDLDADPRLVVAGAGLLGQRLFYPPSVRGWEGGEAWATSASLLLRGELVGMMLGRVSGRDLARIAVETGAGAGERADDEPEDDPSEDDGAPSMQPEMRPQERAEKRRLSPELRALGRLDGRAHLNLTQRLARAGSAGDEALARALVEELLAIPAPAALVARVAERLSAARLEHELGAEPFAAHPELAEPLLRELAHGILALPEAQLD